MTIQKPSWRPCTIEEWDNTPESKREILKYKDGKYADGKYHLSILTDKPHPKEIK